MIIRKCPVRRFGLRQVIRYLCSVGMSVTLAAFAYPGFAERAAAVSFDQLDGCIKVEVPPAVGLETDELLVLVNSDMALAFDRNTFALRGLYDPKIKRDYLFPTSVNDAPTLVGVTLLSPDRREIPAVGFDKAQHRYTWRKTSTGIELILSWIGVSAPGQPGILDIEGRVHLGPEGMSRWTCSVTNRSPDMGLRFVQFPALGRLKAGQGDDPTDYDAGGLSNPTCRTGEASFRPLGEGHYNQALPYQAYYGCQGGVYVCPEDPDYLEKGLRGDTDAATRTALLRHSYYCINAYGEQIKKFESSYPVAVGVFQGDWYDAARIYRKWAIRQPWCAKGTLAKRDDLPDWFKKLDFWEQCAGRDDEEFEGRLKLGKTYGYPLGLWVTHWMIHGFDNKYPDFFPPKMGEEAFKQAISKGHKHGLYYMPYTNAFIYATDAPSYSEAAANAAAKSPDGKPHGGLIEYAGIVHMPYRTMCPATKFWQDKYSEMGRKIIQEYDCDGIYYDQVDVYHTECFDPTHGHPLGGGNSWTQGVRELFARVRRESLAAGKKIVLSGEFWCEPYMGELDIALQQYNKADVLPVYDVVYHDYISTYGYNWQDPRPFLPYVGSIYLAGVQGPTGLASAIYGDNPDIRRLKFLQYLSACRREFAGKYLNLGARLRDPKVLTQLPMVDRGQDAKPRPAVIASAWESNDGDIGCFFMNISDKTLTFDYKIDLATCALEKLGTYTVTRHELGSKTVIEQGNSGSLLKSDTLGSGKLLMIQLSAVGGRNVSN
ncbi:MAG: DUF6259 domain-containing protein [Armatimonadetes bacterium]|nr:DUF6259 domain-containing protein [Armatimonadota bacterium]